MITKESRQDKPPLRLPNIYRSTLSFLPFNCDILIRVFFSLVKNVGGGLVVTC